MLIIGAKGLASELLPILIDVPYYFDETNLLFFDDISKLENQLFFGKFKILRSLEEVSSLFASGKREFCFGFGGVYSKINLDKTLNRLGGMPKSIFSKNSSISQFGTTIGEGTVIVGNAQITSNVVIGKHCLIYMNTAITHDCILGDYVEISPNVSIAGRCNIGSATTIGTGAIIIPDISIGSNCIIGAGTVVTKNIPNNSLVLGIPGRIIKKITPIEI